jgi:hypothetical protein
MRRYSHNQPAHRRSFWAQKPSSYNAYVNCAKIKVRATGDYGMDNFSYDPAHLPQCEVPRSVIKHPTEQLCNVAKDWIYAEAAIYTSLARIDALNDDAPYRLDPETTHRHILGHRNSDDDNSPATSGAESAVSSFSFDNEVTASTPATPATLISTPAIPSQKAPLMHPIPHVPVNMAGLESPPFTPIDSMAVNTPMCESEVHPAGTVPDLAHVTAQLCPLTIRTSLTVSSPGAFSSFSSGSSSSDFKNEQAWEHYLEVVDEEFRDLRQNALRRLKGYADVIHLLLTELVIARKVEKAEVREFDEWYKTKVSVYMTMIYEMDRKTRATSRAVGGERNHRVFVAPA